MEIKRIEELTCDWHAITEKVIELNELDLSVLQELFRETYSVLDRFSHEKLVPKKISKLLLEMNDFGWWVMDLDETPLHGFYQEILSLTTALSKYFLTRDCDIEDIEKAIDKIM